MAAVNLVAMLQSAVTPLADVDPPCQEPRGPHEDVLEKYRAAWQGEEWVKTSVLEKRLGFSPSSARGTLRRWEAGGVLESRKVVGANGKHKRSLGIEWRWK